MATPTDGQELFDFAAQLFPICRSITGRGNRETLDLIAQRIPLTVHEVPSGTRVFDWTVPREWTIDDAYIADEAGNRIVDFRNNNLHVLGYSVPVDRWLDLDELQPHLYSLKDQPDAIPYVTSYYEERWGFCLSHNQRQTLRPGKYRAVIDSRLANGHLTYGECLVRGASEREVFLATNICHPSLGNNETSGLAVATFLAEWLANAPRRLSYRIAFVPETIGAITYLSRNLEAMQDRIIAGYQITCVGDDRAYSYVPSRRGNTLADRAGLHVLEHKHPLFVRYTFRDRGSDERQYCSVGVDLPVASLLRSKYDAYAEYHTSLDDLSLISPSGLKGAFELYQDVLELIERNAYYRTTTVGEPQLSRHNLYSSLSVKGRLAQFRSVFDFIAYADGSLDVIDMARLFNRPAWELYPLIDRLQEAGLIEAVEPSGPRRESMTRVA